MRRKLWILALVLLLSGTILSTSFIQLSRVLADSVNLISNPSVETPDSTGTAPQGWQSSSWGSNTTSFSYPSTGEDGTQSVSIDMTSYTSGDAKWYFTPVTVSPNTSYYFSDYYQSSVSTSLVAWIVDTQGNSQYQTIGSLAASTGWSQAQFLFTTPANAQTVTIFHLINSVGSLQTDNYVLRPQTTPDITNNVPNNSMEQVSDTNSTQPLAWTSNSWGTNTVQFSYLNTGHTGTHSLKTQITSYSDGDAKWFYEPQATQAGVSYRFTDYYESNITTEVYAMINKTNGTTQYLNLHYADPASTWTQYTDTFVTPLNTQSISIFHVIAGVGYLITDDYTLTPYTPVGFNRALVSLTFDDGLRSQYTNALPALRSHSMLATFYLISGFLNTSGYLTTAQARALQQAGDELGSHTVDHVNLTTLSPSQLTYELSQSQQTLQSLFGVPITDFATPEGAYDAQVLAAIQTYYASHRSVDVGYNSKDNFNPYNIRAQSITSTTTISDIQSWIAQAQQNKTWLVLVFHGVDNSGDPYSITPRNLNTVLTNISNAHLPVVTVAQALSELKPQV